MTDEERAMLAECYRILRLLAVSHGIPDAEPKPKPATHKKPTK